MNVFKNCMKWSCFYNFFFTEVIEFLYRAGYLNQPTYISLCINKYIMRHKISIKFCRTRKLWKKVWKKKEKVCWQSACIYIFMYKHIYIIYDLKHQYNCVEQENCERNFVKFKSFLPISLHIYLYGSRIIHPRIIHPRKIHPRIFHPRKIHPRIFHP